MSRRKQAYDYYSDESDRGYDRNDRDSRRDDYDRSDGDKAGATSSGHAMRRSLSFQMDHHEAEDMARDIALEMPGAPKKEHLTPWQQTRRKWVKRLDSTIYNSVMLVATVIALYLVDVNLLVFPKAADTAVGAIVVIVLLLFIIDLIMNSLMVPKYFGRLYFWLDLAATVSLIQDVPWITGAANLSELSIARAGRAARAGTRAGRLIRIFKLFKLYQKRKAEKERRRKLIEQGLNPDTSMDEDDENPKKDMEPSKVGQHLSDLTVQKVIVGVMALVAIIPVLNADALDVSREFAVNSLKGTVPFTIPFGSTIGAVRAQALTNTTIGQWLREVDFTLQEFPETFFLRIKGISIKDEHANAEDTLRPGEVEVWPTSAKPFPLPSDPDIGMFDLKGQSQIAAVFNITLTTFIVILLGVGAWLFQRDADKLVIKPIERMFNFVKTLASDPLAAAKQNDDPKKKKDESETGMVEDALRKIGQLMQIGFGDAGAAIISKNLSSGDGNLDAMVPGQKIHAIFGFCDIRQFTDTTECLQESVMPFVNTVADIVHNATHDNYGSPNKNIGDAFLLVWKTPNEKDKLREVADGAFKSYIRMVEEIEASEDLKDLTNVKVLHDRIPGYSTKMGFGMHYGWAIEGAIGSSLKIDASYLSPHVNLAARLESGTKLYGKMFLFSQDFVELLSPEIADELRRVDRVTLKGSNQPMVLYTYDIETPNSGAQWKDYAHYKKIFESAIDRYISGDWSESGRLFEDCLQQWPEDEPAKVLLWYMSRFNFRPPPSWDGFRELTEK